MPAGCMTHACWTSDACACVLDGRHALKVTVESKHSLSWSASPLPLAEEARHIYIYLLLNFKIEASEIYCSEKFTALRSLRARRGSCTDGTAGGAPSGPAGGAGGPFLTSSLRRVEDGTLYLVLVTEDERWSRDQKHSFVPGFLRLPCLRVFIR